MRILSRILSILLVALLALAGTSALADEASEAVEIAKSVYAQATEHEKEVTSKLQSLETDSAKLVGLDFRQKSEESIARKILLDAHDMEISLAGNEERLLLISRFDNLGKGASGAAIQNMNIALGIEESEGLVI